MTRRLQLEINIQHMTCHLISCALNADSGRYADTLISHIASYFGHGTVNTISTVSLPTVILNNQLANIYSTHSCSSPCSIPFENSWKSNHSFSNYCTKKYPFSGLTLLVWRQDCIRPVKNWVVGCWSGYLCGARCRLAYGPADATATHCLLLQ